MSDEDSSGEPPKRVFVSSRLGRSATRLQLFWFYNQTSWGHSTSTLKTRPTNNIGLVFVKFIFDNSPLWSLPIFNTRVFFQFPAFAFFFWRSFDVLSCWWNVSVDFFTSLWLLHYFELRDLAHFPCHRHQVIFLSSFDRFCNLHAYRSGLDSSLQKQPLTLHLELRSSIKNIRKRKFIWYLVMNSFPLTLYHLEAVGMALNERTLTQALCLLIEISLLFFTYKVPLHHVKAPYRCCLSFAYFVVFPNFIQVMFV